MRVPRFISVNGFIANQDFVLHESHGVESVLRVQTQAQASDARVVTLGNMLRQLVTHLAMIVSDTLTLFLAMAFSAIVCGIDAGIEPKLMLGVSASVLFACFAMLGLYPGIGLTPAVEIRLTSIVVCTVMAAFGAATVLHAHDPWVLVHVGIVWMILLVAIPVARGLTRTLLSRSRWWGAPTIIIGAGETGVSIFESLRDNPTWGLRPIGIVDDSVRSAGAAPAYRGHTSEMENLVREFGVTWCIVATPDRPREEVLRLVDTYAGLIPHTLVVPDLAGIPSLWTGAADCAGFPGLQLKERLLMPGPRLVKRLVDVVLTTLVIVASLPLLLFLAAMVRMTSRGPVFYGQQRLGLNGKPFRAWKFRTMVPNADEVLEAYLQNNQALRQEWELDHKLKNDPRVTLVGQFLRKTSLDELPQVWNVLMGEMSLVGPRPIVQAEVDRYGKCFDLYLRVRPGITGLWQVSGRNNTTYQQRVQLDGYYVRNWSPWLDLCILLATVRVVLLREGAY